MPAPPRSRDRASSPPPPRATKRKPAAARAAPSSRAKKAPARARPAPRRPAAPRSLAWRYRRPLFLLALLGFTAVAGALYVLGRVPLPKEAPLAQTTLLTDVNGARLASFDAGENRVPVPLSSVPKVVRDAVVATEDRNFYEHGGIDPFGIVRATLADLRGQSLQGGSTITQQYVKNVYVGNERTLWRKLREASLAVQLERRYTKDQILERYLNIVYFGRGAYGVQAASRAYFGKDVDQVNLDEAAYLAGLIRAPELADATRNESVARARRDLTLGRMRRAHLITAAQQEAAKKVPLPTFVKTTDEPQVALADKGAQYFVEYVRAELVRRYGKDATFEGGLRVKTSLDLGLQAAAYDAVYGVLDRDNDPAGALVAIDGDGRVRAMVGGRDWNTSKVNYAAGTEGGGSGRPAGSTFKPFTLAAIVKDGWSVQSTFPAPARITLPKADSGKDYVVDNFDNEDFSPSLNLIDATANSVNTVYVQAQQAIGSQKVADMAKALGVTAGLHADASLTLGTPSVSVVDMASAYSTFADRGVHVAPRTILEVRRADGTVLDADREPDRTRVLSRDQADVVSYCLQQVVKRGSGTGAAVPGTGVAGKTGTTEDNADAWFVGYTPKLTAAVWMGYPEGNARKLVGVHGVRAVTGGSLPATIFRRFMAAAAKDPQYAGDFGPAPRLGGRTLMPPKNVVLPTTTTTSTTSTTTAPPAEASTTTTAAKPTTTTSPPAPSTTAAPPSSTAPSTTAAPG
ncbi:MAG TPA: transglycosylase domain-containing protein [Acidimicrobiales bacterium]|nr:transglycosylase domain-containing protein [Acidimicrobiales bacterium]